MNKHWKIFNVINLICLTLVISLVGLPHFNDPYPLADIRDIFLYVLIALIPVTVISNCLHNIFLTRIYAAGKGLSTIRKIFFWILLTLFTIIVLFFLFQFLSSLYFRLKYTGAYRSPDFKSRIFIELLSFSVTGFYIIVMQVILFFRIKRFYRQKLDSFIDEIGS